jgi:two-component system sensor histidine kinase BaeS
MAAEERAMLLDLVYDSATALHLLVEKVSTLSAMHAGQWTFEYTMKDLCTVVRWAVDNATASALAHAVTLTSELPVAAIMRMDPPQLYRAITVLLENAIRFSPSGGQVGVRLVCANGDLCLTVADAGPGIAPDVLPRLFEAFAAGDVQHHTTGHGLSLAIARQIILAHQGTIGVQSRPGMGTIFTVQLPAAL